MFAHRGDIAADCGKEFRTLESSERAGDFLLHFDHADILFCLIVGEGDLEIVEKSKRPVFVVLQAIKQVLGLGLFFAPSFFRDVGHGDDGWINRPSLTKDPLVLLMPFFQTLRREGGSRQLLLLPFSVHIKEEIGQAERMQAGEFKIGAPAIMDESTQEFGQDGKTIQRFSATFTVNSVPGQGRGRENMKPVACSRHP